MAASYRRHRPNADRVADILYFVLDTGPPPSAALLSDPESRS
jgi:hypothetical protein